MATEADIREFEVLVHTSLKPLARRRRDELDKARQTKREIETLLQQIDLLITQANTTTLEQVTSGTEKPLKALIDVGAGFRMHARIGATNTVCIDVGCGIYLELTLDEASRYCAGRLTSLSSLISVLEAEVVKTGADLVIAESGLAELYRAGQPV